MKNKFNRIIDAILCLGNISSSFEFWQMSIVDAYQNMDSDLSMLVDLLVYIYELDAPVHTYDSASELDDTEYAILTERELEKAKYTTPKIIVIDECDNSLFLADMTILQLFCLRGVTTKNIKDFVQMILKAHLLEYGN